MAFALVLAALAGNAASAAQRQPPRAPFDAVVVRVIDGDTVAVRDGARAQRTVLRIHGIDAPEICQPHGRVARAVLLSRLIARPVRVEPVERDTHRRLVARIAAPGTAAGGDVGAWLVREGHAWAYAFRGDRAAYRDEEAAARAARRGLWSDAMAEEPRGFRQRRGGCY